MPLPILVLWKEKCILLKLKVSTSLEKMRASCLFNSSTVHFRSSRSTTFSMRWLGWESRDQRGSPSTSRSPSRSPAWWTSATTHSTNTLATFRWSELSHVCEKGKKCSSCVGKMFPSPIIFRCLRSPVMWVVTSSPISFWPLSTKRIPPLPITW